MNDILMIILVFAFFAATAGLLTLCQRLMEDNP
jgi:hypothetical protein